MNLLQDAEIRLVLYLKDDLRAPYGPHLKYQSALLEGIASRLVADLVPMI